MSKLSDWSTLESAARWLNDEIVTDDFSPTKLLEMARREELYILSTIPSWNRPGHGELLWFDKSGVAHPVGIVSDGKVSLNAKMCEELLFHGRTNLCNATMGDLHAGGPSCQNIRTKNLRIHNTELERLAEKLSRAEIDIAHKAPSSTDEDSGPRWLTKHEIVDAFEHAYRDRKYWGDQVSKNYPAWITRHRRAAPPGDKSGGSTYDPVGIAKELMKPLHGNQSIQNLSRIFRSKIFDDPIVSGWRHTWEKFRDEQTES